MSEPRCSRIACVRSLYILQHRQRKAHTPDKAGKSAVVSSSFTFTLESLSQQAPQEGAAVVAEGQNFKVVDAELVRYVDTEPLRPDLLQKKPQHALFNMSGNTWKP